VTHKLLKRSGMQLADIDLVEINEAFASVVLRYLQAMDLDPEIVNVNGGAIAMGHPLGATGAMLLGTVLDELERRDLNTALVTLCIGAGMGRRRSSSGSDAQDRHRAIPVRTGTSYPAEFRHVVHGRERQPLGMRRADPIWRELHAAAARRGVCAPPLA
jgi:hypothetical protein